MRKVEIELNDLEFYAYHGYYEEERKAGNRFMVDVKVESRIGEEADLGDLTNTINYEELYQLVKLQMLKPSELLEQIAGNILENILSRWKQAVNASVSISKMTPPIGGVCKKAVVTLSESR